MEQEYFKSIWFVLFRYTFDVCGLKQTKLTRFDNMDRTGLVYQNINLIVLKFLCEQKKASLTLYYI